MAAGIDRFQAPLAPASAGLNEGPFFAALFKVQGAFNVIYLAGAMKADIFVAGADPFNAERLRCRQHVSLTGDAHFFVDAAEHSVLRKLEWYRRGGETSERQWRDVLAVLRVQRGRLDESRLKSWAARLDVSDPNSLVTRLGVGASLAAHWSRIRAKYTIKPL